MRGEKGDFKLKKTAVKRERERRRRKKKKVFHQESKLQHPDFARGHPPHYYPGRNVLDFADRTGCGILTIVWP